MQELVNISQRIGRLILVDPADRKRRLDRPLAWRCGEGGRTLQPCQAEEEGAFQADGRGLHIAFLCTGLPPDLPRPLSRMDICLVGGAADPFDTTGHDRLNFILLNQWLPQARYTVFVLPYFERQGQGLVVYDHHLDEALRQCRSHKDLDFVISSITPSTLQFLDNSDIFPSSEAGETVVSFWPTGNWIPGTSKSSLGPVDPHVILSGQTSEVRPWGVGRRQFRLRPDARYDQEHELPHFWIPGPVASPGAVGSSYSTVPTALVWIKFVQILRFLKRYGFIGAHTSESPAFVRPQLKNSRSYRRRMKSRGHAEFPDSTRGLINLPAALERMLYDQLQDPQAQIVLAGLYPQRRGWLGWVWLAAVLGSLAGGWGGYTFHVDLWAYYAPGLDRLNIAGWEHFAGWTHSVAVFEPAWVLGQAHWSGGFWAAAGGIAPWLGAGVYGLLRRVRGS
ncbi:MAG: hypothetical protein GKR89_15870 [Candidatus Latescibacteria bacterium]|nr:hypothetical protein [Candidatus Latescibacterota bacterium]